MTVLSTLSVVSSSVPKVESLLMVLHNVPDPRDPRGVRYRLPGLLAAAVCAVLSGARSFVALGEWIAEAPLEVLQHLGFLRTGVNESTLRRVFQVLDGTQVDDLLGAWVASRFATVQDRTVIAIDGKTLRGSRDKKDPKSKPHHLVAAITHMSGLVVGQCQTPDKGGEIKAARALITSMNIENAVVTLDALHTQTDTAQLIVDKGWDFVLTVKGNQKNLHHKLKALPWKDLPSISETTHGKGKRVTRSIKVADVPDWVPFPGATQIARVARTVSNKKTRKRTMEIVYLITSASPQHAPPVVLLAWIRGHWAIENCLHWVRDVTFDEDRSQIRTGNSPRIMATLRNLAITLLRQAGHTNIAKALRHTARDPTHALHLINNH